MDLIAARREVKHLLSTYYSIVGSSEMRQYLKSIAFRMLKVYIHNDIRIGSSVTSDYDYLISIRSEYRKLLELEYIEEGSDLSIYLLDDDELVRCYAEYKLKKMDARESI